ASVSAAVNSVSNEQIWTQHTLFDAWKKQGGDQVHFGNIARVATDRVRDRVQTHQMLKACIDAGGIAIVSFQIENSHLNRQPAWHMLSLIRRDGDKFTASDTAAGNEL